MTPNTAPSSVLSNLISELERKLFRILSVENTKSNSFRQHITDVKHFLLQELESDKQQNG